MFIVYVFSLLVASRKEMYFQKPETKRTRSILNVQTKLMEYGWRGRQGTWGWVEACLVGG